MSHPLLGTRMPDSLEVCSIEQSDVHRTVSSASVELNCPLLICPSGAAEHKVKRVLLALTLLLITVAFAQDDLNQWIQLLKQDLKVQRKDVITKGMQTFTHEEAKRFWPIYDAYNSELEKFVDARVALIKANAEDYDSMPDAEARDLLNRRINI